MESTFAGVGDRRYVPTPYTLGARYVAWSVVATLFAFLANVYLSFWRKWPGAEAAFGPEAPALAWAQVSIYALALVAPAVYVLRTRSRTLRQDDAAMTRLAAYVAAAAFWCVLLVGVADYVISFLRVEGFLENLFGHQLATDLGRNQFRAPYVHGPLIVASLVIAAVARPRGSRGSRCSSSLPSCRS